MRRFVLSSCLAVVVVTGPTFADSTTNSLPEAASTTTNRLPEVVVTAARLPEEQIPVMKMPANVTVIDQAQIAASPSFTLTELLRQQVGLVPTGTGAFGGGGGGNLVMRGFGERSGTVFLVDGVRVNDAGDATGPFLWNSIPLDSIERIEVIRGGASTIYGEGAISGVINVITKQPTNQTATATATAAGGNLGYYTGHFDGSLKEGSFDCFVSGDRQEWTGWRDFSAFRSWSSIVKPSMDTTVGKFTLSYYLHDETSQNPGNLTAAQLAANPRQSVAGNGVLLEDHENRGSLDYFKSLDSGLTLVSKVYGQVYNSSSTWQGALPLKVQQPNYGSTFQASYDSDVRGRSNKLTVGAELVKQDFSSNDSYGDLNQINNWTGSFFAQDTYKLTAKLSASTGVRYDHRESNINILEPFVLTYQGSQAANVWSPKAALTYEFTEKTASWISLSRSYHLPLANDIANAGYNPILAQKFVANPNIDPSVSNQIEIGIRCQQYNLLGGSLTYYYNHTHDDILFDPAAPGGGFFGSNGNFDDNRHGVELSLTSQPADWVDFYYTTAFTDARFDGGTYGGHHLPMVPEWQLTGGTNWRPIKNWQFTIEAVHVRDQVAINDVKNVSALNQYVVLNAKIAYRWNRLTMFTAVNNLCDRLYETYPAYSTFAGVQRYNPVAGINFRAGVSATF